MANGTSQFDPLAWALGLLGTISLAWVGATSRKTQQHEVKIAVIETNICHIKKSLNRMEKHFGIVEEEE